MSDQAQSLADFNALSAFQSPVYDGVPLFNVLNLEGTSPVLLTCEHGGIFMPEKYKNLGLVGAEMPGFDAVNTPADIRKLHFAWDFGAEEFAKSLYQKLDASLIHHNFSRLLADVNRPAWEPAKVVSAVQDAVTIPGNRSLKEEEINERIDLFYTPYLAASNALVERHLQKHPKGLIIACHSYVRMLVNGIDSLGNIVERRQRKECDILCDDHQMAEADILRAGLVKAGLLDVGINDAYTGGYKGTMPQRYTHLCPAFVIEIRNDLLADEAGNPSAEKATWFAEKIAEGIRLAFPDFFTQNPNG